MEKQSRWFTESFIDFLEALEQNNDRAWFNANKHIFQSEVEQPFHRFVGEMLQRLEREEGPYNGRSTKDYVFRIYRDVRFSKDKRPYKVQMSALLTPDGRKAATPMGLYIEANHQRLHVYEGIFRPPKEMLYRIREAIAAQPERFIGLMEHPKLTGAFTPLLGEVNKRLPKEFQEAAQRIPLIYHKSFYFRAELPKDVLLLDNLPDVIMEYHRLAEPFNRFLKEALTD